MWFQPFGEVIPRNLYRLVRLVSRVDLGVDSVAFCQGFLQEAVHMGRERPEGHIVAHKTVDVDDKQYSPIVLLRQRRQQRLSRR